MDWMKLKAILSCCAVELVHNNINNIFLWCWNYFLFHKVSTEKLWQYCRSSPGGSDPTISLVSVLEVTILSTISVWSSSNQQNVILIVLGRKYSQLFAELITVLAAKAMGDVSEQNTKLFQTFWVTTFICCMAITIAQTNPSTTLYTLQNNRPPRRAQVRDINRTNPAVFIKNLTWHLIFHHCQPMKNLDTEQLQERNGKINSEKVSGQLSSIKLVYPL